MNARVSPRVWLFVVLLAATGCVRYFSDGFRNSLTNDLSGAEAFLGAKKYADAQTRVDWAYQEFASAADRGQTSVGAVAESEPLLWARLTAVDSELEKLAENAPRQLGELAKQGDASAAKDLIQLTAQRHPLGKGREERGAEWDAALDGAIASAFEVFLSRGEPDAARTILDARWSPFAEVARKLLDGKPGCQRTYDTVRAWRLQRNSLPAIAQKLVLERAAECGTELEGAATVTFSLLTTARWARDELRFAGVAADADPRAAIERKLAASEAEAAQQNAASAAADAERERKLVPVRAELEKAAARKDLAKACALAKEYALPVPDALRGAELAALAEWEAHRVRARSSEWPASAWLHALWLRASGDSFRDASPAAQAWAAPVSNLSLDWRHWVASEDCFPYESRDQSPTTWKVLSVDCSAAPGQLVTSDVLETSYVRTARLRYDGKVDVFETKVTRKVGQESVRLNATRAAVTLTVEAPFAHEKLVLRVTGSVPNLQSQVDQGFLFTLAGAARRDHPAWDLPAALMRQYLAEVDRLKADWRTRALSKATPEDEREEAFARLVLLDPKKPDAEALAYFRERYHLEGSSATALKLRPPPATCP